MCQYIGDVLYYNPIVISIIYIFFSIRGSQNELGSFLNDEGRYFNCKMKFITPTKIGIFSVKNILKNEELTYNYNEKNLSWRKMADLNFKFKNTDKSADAIPNPEKFCNYYKKYLGLHL